MGGRQKGGEMKFLPLLALMLISMAAFAYEVDEEGHVLVSEQEKAICVAKGDVTMFVYQHRDEVSRSDAFEILDRDWNEAWKSIEGMSHATYVDMQRIINDAYRTERDGSYRRDCCSEEIAEEETIKEILACIRDGY